jgi:hypothetical protein
MMLSQRLPGGKSPSLAKPRKPLIFLAHPTRFECVTFAFEESTRCFQSGSGGQRSILRPQRAPKGGSRSAPKAKPLAKRLV